MATLSVSIQRRQIDIDYNPSTLSADKGMLLDQAKSGIEAHLTPKERDSIDWDRFKSNLGALLDRNHQGTVSAQLLAGTHGKDPKDIFIGVRTGETEAVLGKRSASVAELAEVPFITRGSVAALAGGDGDPPRRPDGTGLKKPHYLDIEETGYMPVKSLTGIRMAQQTRRSPHVDPATRSERDEGTRELALRQTTAARDLLYHPSDTFRSELGQAAGVLRAIATQLDAENQRALGARLLGSEGLLPRQAPNRLIETLQRVENDPVERGASATDRAIVIALMGDIGALYADTGATTGVENRSAQQAEILRDRLRFHMDQMELASVTPEVVRDVQRLGGSSAVGPGKKAERTRPENEKPPRTGIHNLGFEADVDLGIPDRQMLPTSRWDVAHIRRDRVNQTQEPLVGHMSGSPAEILQVWDMLRGVAANRQYVGTMRESALHPNQHPMAHLSREEQEQLYARAAGAAAFLVGLGYHSAVEVVEGVLAYTGQSARGVLQSPRQDAGHLFGQGAATDLIEELFRGHTQRPPREDDEQRRDPPSKS